MERFVVIDVETPNHLNDRISAIGVTVVENGTIVDSFYSLVNPNTYFDAFNVRLTGIDDKKVADAPVFPEVWTLIEPTLNSGIIVAHNAVFDLGVLRKCLHFYNISWKSSINYLCTVQIGRRLLPSISHKLNVLCDYYDIELNHHNADSDSFACANILIKYLEKNIDVDLFIKTFNL